jgi:hypothetical protein
VGFTDAMELATNFQRSDSPPWTETVAKLREMIKNNRFGRTCKHQV